MARGYQTRVGSRARILIADDEQNLCRVLMARFAKDGYEATAVHDGAQALRSLSAAHHDLVVLDLHMPVLGGLEILPAIRQNHPATAVVVVTAYDNPESVSAAQAAGADAYLTKPLDLDALLTDVAQILAGRRAAKPRRARGSASGARPNPTGMMLKSPP